DGETDALHTLDLHDLRTKHAGQFPMVAFGEQIEIHLTQLRTEAVRIFGYMHATRPADAQQIGLRMRQPREEQARDLPLLHRSESTATGTLEHFHTQRIG